MMRVGSLFSGIGGIELGLEKEGFETAWFVEKDPYAQAVLRKHWPTTTIYGDITTINFTELPRIDVLTGGFPCQDISNAGKRVGITGSRSSLWKHYLRAINELRPRYVFAENVAALTQRGLGVVLCDLAALGYDAEWHCVPASAVGAPHRRDRIIIIALPNRETWDATTTKLSEHRQKRTEVGNEHRTIRENVSYSNEQRCDNRRDNREERHVLHHEIRDSTENKPERERRERRLREDCSIIQNSDSTNVPPHGERRVEPQVHGQHSTGRSKEESSRVGCGWWAVEPNVGRVANGIPRRVDRIKCLGNAVVPQWAQAVGRTIRIVDGGERND
jgi:DNA (cytosine-5)-methyltransferase 1